MRTVKVMLLVTILLSVGAMGCLKEDPDFASPLSAIPKVLVDHIDDTTKVYVKAMDDHRYTNMTTRIFDGNVTYVSVSEDNVYVQKVQTNRTGFTLNVTIIDKKKTYSFEGNFTVRPGSDPDQVFLISISNPKGKPKEKKVMENDLPWRTLIDRVD